MIYLIQTFCFIHNKKTFLMDEVPTCLDRVINTSPSDQKSSNLSSSTSHLCKHLKTSATFATNQQIWTKKNNKLTKNIQIYQLQSSAHLSFSYLFQIFSQKRGPVRRATSSAEWSGWPVAPRACPTPWPTTAAPCATRIRTSRRDGRKKSADCVFKVEDEFIKIDWSLLVILNFMLNSCY